MNLSFKARMILGIKTLRDLFMLYLRNASNHYHISPKMSTARHGPILCGNIKTSFSLRILPLIK